MRLRLFVVLLGAAPMAARPSPAQQSYATSQSTPLLTHADSLSALHALDDRVRTNREDADAWHTRGVLAWRLSDAERRAGFMRRLANDSLLALADSSLRLAVRYAPGSAGYLVDQGRFYLTSNSAAVRGRAAALFQKAAAEARHAGDRITLARALDEQGMTWWRRYDDRANRTIYSYVSKALHDRTFLKDPRSIAYYIDNQAIRAASQDWSGQEEYLHAQDDFADALAADPANAGALRHTYMLLADRQRWAELEAVSRTRIAQDSTDAWAWLANGLAAHRLGDERVAARAFHAALARLSDTERAYVQQLSRILTSNDSAQVAHLPEAEQVNLQQRYWLMSDPLWAAGQNDNRLEYLSRLVYAELRFSAPEFGIRGADTERGEVLVRYGPPPAIISFPPDPTERDDHRPQVLWWYSTTEAFLFRQLPGYGVATLESRDLRQLRQLRDTIPVVWRDAGDAAPPDSIGVQTVRFRAQGDSSDVYVAANIPVSRLARGVDLARGALQVNFDAYTWRADPVIRDSARERITFGGRDTNEAHTWAPRVAPGTYLFRVEALQPDAMRGARAAGRLDIAPLKGFAMSDVLVARRITPRTAARPDRWSDFDITPSFGLVHRHVPFGILWETYDLAAKNGSDDYTVRITVKQLRAHGIGSIIAKIVGGVASAIGMSGGGEGTVSLAFPRRVPAQAALVDYITLDLGAAAPGVYRLSVSITDNNSGRHVVRESPITVIE
ncbi:MAG TPA: GWxTD domain-containing protein [Gemmatimonadaceae bacterium]|nr:GWxTD domain-containing protein [Gemmatimonadaceae bacterium]